MHGFVDEKTDVFAFGVLLLEIISGKKPVDGSHQSLHSWVNEFTLQQTYANYLHHHKYSFLKKLLDFHNWRSHKLGAM